MEQEIHFTGEGNCSHSHCGIYNRIHSLDVRDSKMQSIQTQFNITLNSNQ